MGDHDRDRTQTVNLPGGLSDPRAANLDDISTQVLTDKSNRVVGHLVVTEGQGAGQVRAIYSGTNQMGRSAENRVPLDFGDNTISRTQHAIIACDAPRKIFTILDGGKRNPITVNGQKLEGERRIYHGDLIKIGMTTLRFTIA